MGRKFGGLDIEKIARKTGTPTLVFDANLIEANYHRFIKSFSKYYPATVFFSVKTNNELQVLKKLQSLGASAQVSGGLEMYLCEKAGFKYSQMILDGPGKSLEDLEQAFKKGIFAYNGDSYDDIVRANNIGKKLKKRVNVGLRIQPYTSGSLAKTVEFYLSKFGVPIQDAFDTIKKLSQLKYVNLVGLHAHIGSQVLEVAPFLKTVDLLTKLAADLKQLGINIEYIDLGGGIPSPTLLRYSPIQIILKNFFGLEQKVKVMPMDYYGEAISKRIAENIKKFNLQGVKIIFEPGRAIVSNAGVTVSRVLSVKGEWVFIDASITFIPENVFFTERQLSSPKRSNLKKKYHVAGSSLLTPDFFTKGKLLPQLNVGDIIVIDDCGAYTMSRSSQFTTMRPPVYMIENGKIKLIRRKDNYVSFCGPMVD